MMYTNQATYAGAIGEVFTKPSLTVPGQTLTLKEIIERYVRGQNIETFPGVYDDTIPEGVEKMDVFDRLDMARDIKTAIHRHQTRPPKPEKPAPDPAPPAPSLE